MSSEPELVEETSHSGMEAIALTVGLDYYNSAGATRSPFPTPNS
ncbi:hypothetical protein [Thermocoleostomius sinensis]|uniref:Uncharacterized protein n=1 Tax=Thermocoleostomius sinensis A174 TaxID=2016057 RepID=A0A9E9CAA0_9CYAN|nr:hypothetical protein [Thermocoleostomius sinensis]WAL62613.1 hypothetical protein OXH18_11655 [Thermocoleostomius sinensis A174]